MSRTLKKAVSWIVAALLVVSLPIWVIPVAAVLITKDFHKFICERFGL